MCCASLSGASEGTKEAHSEVKQEKRSLSHGVLGGGYPINSYPSFGGSYGSYDAGSLGSSSIIAGGGDSGWSSEPSISSGPITISGGSGSILPSAGPSYIGSSGPSYIGSSGPSYIGSSGSGYIGSSGPGFIGSAGPGFIGSAGPGIVSSGTVSGISTNTNTLTTVRQNVPVPVPVDRPVPV